MSAYVNKPGARKRKKQKLKGVNDRREIGHKNCVRLIRFLKYRAGAHLLSGGGGVKKFHLGPGTTLIRHWPWW